MGLKNNCEPRTKTIVDVKEIVLIYILDNENQFVITINSESDAIDKIEYEGIKGYYKLNELE